VQDVPAPNQDGGRPQGMLLSCIFPPVCLACGLLLCEATPALPLCRGCAPEAVALPPDERTIDGITALFEYEGPLATAITRLKFGGDVAVAGPIGRLLAATPEIVNDPLSGAPRRWDLLAPLPLHPRRALQRGYDQAVLLTTWLARAWPQADAPQHRARLLRRTRATTPQTELGGGERRSNVRGAFAVRAGELARGQRILLVDDVTTTGASLNAGRSALLAAGATEVAGLALLRALP